jgi:hypothetical protein
MSRQVVDGIMMPLPVEAVRNVDDVADDDSEIPVVLLLTELEKNITAVIGVRRATRHLPFQIRGRPLSKKRTRHGCGKRKKNIPMPRFRRLEPTG